ncbi:MAG TPA: hypothetical protein VMV69_02250 [Pirellulales bacterium]|nr:hypothetical protein [Pirellulales bacterium]
MRRLLILTTVAVLTASAGGCQLFNRGSSCGRTSSTYSADPCMQAPSVSMPSDGTILPGPSYTN